jgi:hypothetical protein
VKRLQIIGLSGKAGSGKDFVGREVLRPLGYKQWAYAWPLKMACVGLGETFEDVMVNKPPRVRDVLQKFGTEEGREKYGRDYWVRQLGGWLRIMSEEFGLHKFYVTDVRFPNEVEYIQSLGGKVVRLDHGKGLIYPLAGTPDALHSSETALDDYTGFDAGFANSPAISPAVIEEYLRVTKILPPKILRELGDARQLTLLH